jgi:hypothetical protein
MTENKEVVEKRRKEIAEEQEQSKVVGLSHTFGDDHWVHTLTGGRQIKVFEDRRKKDEVIFEGLK